MPDSLMYMYIQGYMYVLMHTFIHIRMYLCTYKLTKVKNQFFGHLTELFHNLINIFLRYMTSDDGILHYHNIEKKTFYRDCQKLNT